nr:hypothetical protein [Treponema sp.]
MKKNFIILICLILFTTSACANGNSSSKVPDTRGLSDMKIKIEITSDSGSHTLTATLADNSSARAFYELLQKGS